MTFIYEYILNANDNNLNVFLVARYLQKIYNLFHQVKQSKDIKKKYR